jgi:hypothetical protein
LAKGNDLATIKTSANQSEFANRVVQLRRYCAKNAASEPQNYSQKTAVKWSILCLLFCFLQGCNRALLISPFFTFVVLQKTTHFALLASASLE